ncbi:unnamed protein product [Owenia fusiformis]|uniref:Uncharacterized protein n=1 Tax=Owenia fusiformis TaxID=6347 RepID=A0A8J1XPA3_OWEFU|nr:unnamed protein product [Owenia fusiformis]
MKTKKTAQKAGRRQLNTSVPNQYKPIAKKRVFLDLKNYRGKAALEADLELLGATIEKCFSREVNFLVTNAVTPKEVMSYRNASSSNAATPSPFNMGGATPLGIDSPSQDSPSNPENKGHVTRGRVMAQKARVTQSSSVIDNARKLKIKVIHVISVEIWVEKEKEKIPLAARQNNKKEVKDDKVTKEKKMTAPFVKFEATNKHYKPYCMEFATFPSPNMQTKKWSCPFDPRDQKNVVRGERAELEEAAEEADHPGMDGTNKRASVKGGESSDVLGIDKLTTAGQLKNYMLEKRKEEQRKGYCECCQLRYDDLEQHIRGEQHRKFVATEENFTSLDSLIQQGPNMQRFLDDVLRYHTIHQVEAKLESHEDKEEIALLTPYKSPARNIKFVASKHAKQSPKGKGKDHKKSYKRRLDISKDNTNIAGQSMEGLTSDQPTTSQQSAGKKPDIESAHVTMRLKPSVEDEELTEKRAKIPNKEQKNKQCQKVTKDCDNAVSNFPGSSQHIKPDRAKRKNSISPEKLNTPNKRSKSSGKSAKPTTPQSPPQRTTRSHTTPKQTPGKSKTEKRMLRSSEKKQSAKCLKMSVESVPHSHSSDPNATIPFGNKTPQKVINRRQGAHKAAASSNVEEVSSHNQTQNRKSNDWRILTDRSMQKMFCSERDDVNFEGFKNVDTDLPTDLSYKDLSEISIPPTSNLIPIAVKQSLYKQSPLKFKTKVATPIKSDDVIDIMKILDKDASSEWDNTVDSYLEGHIMKETTKGAINSFVLRSSAKKVSGYNIVLDQESSIKENREKIRKQVLHKSSPVKHGATKAVLEGKDALKVNTARRRPIDDVEDREMEEHLEQLLAGVQKEVLAKPFKTWVKDIDGKEHEESDSSVPEYKKFSPTAESTPRCKNKPSNGATETKLNESFIEDQKTMVSDKKQQQKLIGETRQDTTPRKCTRSAIEAVPPSPGSPSIEAQVIIDKDISFNFDSPQSHNKSRSRLNFNTSGLKSAKDDDIDENEVTIGYDRSPARIKMLDQVSAGIQAHLTSGPSSPHTKTLISSSKLEESVHSKRRSLPIEIPIGAILSKPNVMKPTPENSKTTKKLFKSLSDRKKCYKLDHIKTHMNTTSTYGKITKGSPKIRFNSIGLNKTWGGFKSSSQGQSRSFVKKVGNPKVLSPRRITRQSPLKPQLSPKCSTQDDARRSNTPKKTSPRKRLDMKSPSKGKVETSAKKQHKSRSPLKGRNTRKSPGKSPAMKGKQAVRSSLRRALQDSISEYSGHSSSDFKELNSKHADSPLSCAQISSIKARDYRRIHRTVNWAAKVNDSSDEFRDKQTPVYKSKSNGKRLSFHEGSRRALSSQHNESMRKTDENMKNITPDKGRLRERPEPKSAPAKLRQSKSVKNGSPNKKSPSKSKKRKSDVANIELKKTQENNSPAKRRVTRHSESNQQIIAGKDTVKTPLENTRKTPTNKNGKSPTKMKSPAKSPSRSSKRTLRNQTKRANMYYEFSEGSEDPFDLH